jgi:drug/metabolite transporter (DMT)-like permease
VTMFAWAVLQREVMPVLRVVGAAVALAGLALLVWPWQAIADSALDVAAMALAGLGWGVYSLAGRGSADPLADTAVNFALAAMVFPLLLAALPVGPMTLAPPGVALAMVSGAVTSGLGYALWYAVLPRLPASVAAVAQLTVPPLAALGGVLTLGETVGAGFAVSALVILGGVALSVLGPGYFNRVSRGS